MKGTTDLVINGYVHVKNKGDISSSHPTVPSKISEHAKTITEMLLSE